MLQNFFSGLEIYFKGFEIYFSAAEIYFQATEIVLLRAAEKFILRVGKVYPVRRGGLYCASGMFVLREGGGRSECFLFGLRGQTFCVAVHFCGSFIWWNGKLSVILWGKTRCFRQKSVNPKISLPYEKNWTLLFGLRPGPYDDGPACRL